jgi:pimeloyl-ACP methyl ester carboxylesterase
VARFLLVHGAFSGKWYWEPLIPELEARGHTVEAIDLPGHGEDRTPIEHVTLEAYAERVTQALRADGPAILVGHSMGGIPVTQAAAKARDHVDRLIYITAFLPRDGQSLMSLAALPEGQGDGVQANLVIEPPIATLPPQAQADVLYSGCSPEQIAWAVPHGQPQALAPLGEPVALDGGIDDIDCYYVLCTEDRAIPIALQRLMSTETPCREVVELACGHSPFFSATTEVAAILDGFARA